MMLRAGVRYVRKDGQVTGPLARREDWQYPFHDPAGEQNDTWMYNGSYYSDGTETMADLVRAAE